MPSPFPGMDPYLEAPDGFRDFHDSLIVALKFDLQPRLPAGVFARTNRRLWLERDETGRYPDLGVEARPSGGAVGDDGGFAAVAAVGTPLVIDAATPEPVYETLLEIRTTDDAGARVVAAIEVVSPTNKRPGENARGSYLQKQREYLASDACLIEIDLLRGGTHVTAVDSGELRAAADRFDYHVCLRHPAEPGRFLTYPFTLRDPLPTIPVPLGGDRPPAEVNLQTVFTTCFDLSRYGEQLDYRPPPPAPRLSPANDEWCGGLLTAAGLR